MFSLYLVQGTVYLSLQVGEQGEGKGELTNEVPFMLFFILSAENSIDFISYCVKCSKYGNSKHALTQNQ